MMSLATAFRRGAVPVRPARFGQSEILRKSSRGSLVAQLSRAFEAAPALRLDHVRGERSLRELVGRPAAYRPGFLRARILASTASALIVAPRAASKTSERFALRLRQVHAGAEPVARGRWCDEQARDFVPERVAGRREVPAERENHERRKAPTGRAG